MRRLSSSQQRGGGSRNEAAEFGAYHTIHTYYHTTSTILPKNDPPGLVPHFFSVHLNNPNQCGI
eukprot:scaffold2376_cov188-Amphora_coffeaeformis.AAC.2